MLLEERDKTMCGIAGFKTEKPHPEEVLDSMLKALYHRGPDSEGRYRSGGYCAGMRRLKINDLEHGDQPLFNRDKTVVLLYNGEIYNFPELRASLESKGYRFRTASDGEVICHLYEEHGEDLFELLDGMFAVALWSERERKLILARDIPGEKPLYYAQISSNALVFASEIKGLAVFPGLDLALDYQSLWDYPTFLWIPEPATVYRSVRALLPGHLLVADDNGIRIHKYRNLFVPESCSLSDADVIAATRNIVEDAVASRLLSDVPVGAFLSSGLDSSIVTTIAVRNLAELSTFTIGFENLSDPYHGSSDESRYAEEYARRLGTRHHTIRVDADTFLRNLKIFCLHGDQPFAVSSGLGILAIAEAAQNNGVKVLLSGDGADECFGGYSWYSYLNKVSFGKTKIIEPDNVSFQNFGMTLKERLNVFGSYTPQHQAWAWHYYASESEKRQLFAREPFEGIEHSERFFLEFKADALWGPEDFIKQDRQFYFPNEMLKKIDRMTMAHSVEGRAPFAAPSVLAFADTLKYHHCSRNGTIKWALRKAFEDLLPPEVSNRPKHGFNVPIDHWLKHEWAGLLEEAFSLGSALSRAGLIHSGSRNYAHALLNDPIRLNGHTIFTYVMLNLWLESSGG